MKPRLQPAVHDFVQMRARGLLYVDKTHQIRNFLDRDSALLFTRPRRFGKSLLLSTIKAMYEKKQHLFAAASRDEAPLAVYDDSVWDWKSHPRVVLSLDMSVMEADAQGITGALANKVRDLARQCHMTDQYDCQAQFPAASLANLLQALADREGQMVYRQATQDSQQGQPWSDLQLAQRLLEVYPVILVDEYDAPIFNHLHSPQASRIRSQLADFYGVFKEKQACLFQLVLTGITRFVRVGLWSKLNHVNDVTQDPEFHELVGFTDSDLDGLSPLLAVSNPLRAHSSTMPAYFPGRVA